MDKEEEKKTPYLLKSLPPLFLGGRLFLNRIEGHSSRIQVTLIENRYRMVSGTPFSLFHQPGL